MRLTMDWARVMVSELVDWSLLERRLGARRRELRDSRFSVSSVLGPALGGGPDAARSSSGGVGPVNLRSNGRRGMGRSRGGPFPESAILMAVVASASWPRVRPCEMVTLPVCMIPSMGGGLSYLGNDSLTQRLITNACESWVGFCSKA